jgi:hypothetical protein
MTKKLYKGFLTQVTPCKGYGFISPMWNTSGDPQKNIYCHYGNKKEKERKKCFIGVLSPNYNGEFAILQNKRGEETYALQEPQIIYFEVALQTILKKKGRQTKACQKIMAVNLIDARHITKEAAVEAEANSASMPDFSYLREEATETPLEKEEGAETSSQEEKPVPQEAAGASVEEEDPYNENPRSCGYTDGENAGYADGQDQLESYDLEGYDPEYIEGFNQGYANGLEKYLEERYGSLYDEESICEDARPRKNKEWK